jgi:hypothetical protein
MTQVTDFTDKLHNRASIGLRDHIKANLSPIDAASVSADYELRYRNERHDNVLRLLKDRMRD